MVFDTQPFDGRAEQRTAKFRMSKEGILSILSKKIERSLRLVEAAAPTPRKAIPPFVTRHSLFQSFFLN